MVDEEELSVGSDVDPSKREEQLLPWSVPLRAKVGGPGCRGWGGVYSHEVGIKSLD